MIKHKGAKFLATIIFAINAIFAETSTSSPNPCTEGGPYEGSENWRSVKPGALSGSLSISKSSVTVAKGKFISKPTVNSTLVASDATQDGTRIDTYDCCPNVKIDLPTRYFPYSTYGPSLIWTSPSSGPPSSIISKGSYSFQYKLEQVFTNSEVPNLYSSKNGTFRVIVPPMKATIDKTTLTCEQNTATITVTGDYNAQFISTNSNIASVSSSGRVTAKGEGKVDIIVRDNHDGDEKTFRITVENGIESIDHSIPEFVPADSSLEHTVTVNGCFGEFKKNVTFSASEAVVTRVSGTTNQFIVKYPNPSSAVDASTISFSYNGMTEDPINTTAVKFLTLTDYKDVCLDSELDYTLTIQPSDANIPITWSTPDGEITGGKTQSVNAISEGNVSVSASWEGLSLSDDFEVHNLELSGDYKISVNTKGIVTISGGTGSYRATSSKPDYASVKINGSTMTIEGLKATVEGENAKQEDLVVITVYDKKSGCTETWGVLIADCASCLCETGDDITGLNSLNVHMGLGKYAKIEINELKPSPELSTPAVFNFSKYRSNVETIYENDYLRQVYDGKYLSDIIVYDQFSYSVKVYLASGLTKGTNGLYSTHGLTLSKETAIVNPDRNPSNTRITVFLNKYTGTTGQHSEFSDFYFDSNTNSWTLGKGPDQTSIKNRESLQRTQTFLNFDPQFTLGSTFVEREEAGLAQSFTPGKYASVDEDYISDTVTLESMTFNTSTAENNSSDPVELRIYSSFSEPTIDNLVAVSQNTQVLNVADTAFTWNFTNVQLDKETTYYACFYSNDQPVAPNFLCGFDSYFGGNAYNQGGIETYCDFSFLANLTSDGSTIIDTEIQTRTMSELDGTEVSKTVSTYKNYPFGRSMISEVQDPNGAALTTTWIYHTTEGQDGYGEVSRETRPSGIYMDYTYNSNNDVLTQTTYSAQGVETSFVINEYDEQFRLIKRSEPFNNSLSTQGETNHRVTTYDYTPVIENDTLAYSGSSPRTQNVFLAGQHTSTTYFGYEEGYSTTIRAISPGAAYDDPANLVTETFTTLEEDFRDQVIKQINPDDSGSLITYLKDDLTITTTTQSGVFNDTFDAILYGTTTVEVEVDEILKSKIVTDIESGIVIASETYTHDEYDRVVRTDFLNGQYEERVYSCCGLRSVRAQDGTTEIYHIDSFNRRYSTTRNGLTSHNYYDALGRVIKVVQYPGEDIAQARTVSESVYNHAGQLIATKDAAGAQTNYHYTYDADGNEVTTTTYPNGGTVISSSDSQGNQSTSGTAAIASTSSSSESVEIDHELGYAVLVLTSTSNNSWQKSYQDALGRSYKTQDSTGRTSDTYFNDLGQVIKTSNNYGQVSLFAYNDKNQRYLTAIDVNLNDQIDPGIDYLTVTRLSITGEGDNIQRLTETWIEPSTIDPSSNSNIKEKAFIIKDKVVTVNDEYSKTIEKERDKTDPTVPTTIVTTIQPDGTKEKTTYKNGLRTTQAYFCERTILKYKIKFIYDQYNRLIEQDHTINGKTYYTYNANGQVESVTLPDPDGSGPLTAPTTTNTYDAMGNLVIITRPDGSNQYSKYNLKGQLVQQFGAGLSPRQYAYNTDGQQSSVSSWSAITPAEYAQLPASADWNTAIAAPAQVTSYDYDNEGQRIATTYPGGDTLAWSYDIGRLSTVTNARNQVSTYNYSANGRLAGIDYSDPNTTDLSYTYKPSGQVATVTDATGTHSYEYSNQGITLSSTSQGYTTTNTPDSLGRTSSMSLNSPSQGVIYDMSYTYGTYALSMTQGTHSYEYDYDALGRVSAFDIKESGISKLNSTRTYNAHNRIAALNWSAGNSYTYTYNDLGLLTKENRSNGTEWDYGYTDKDQLNAATDGAKEFAFEFDQSDSMTTLTEDLQATTYTHNPDGQITSINADNEPNTPEGAPLYDADGNMIDLDGMNLVYDQLNRLIELGNGSEIIRYTYDYQNRRTDKQIYDLNDNLLAHTRYLYQGQRVLAEIDVLTDELQKTYTWGLYIDELLSYTDHSDPVNPQTYYVASDRQYSVRTVVDSDGNIVEERNYSPMGVDLEGNAESSDLAYGFTGRRYDSESGLYYFRARYYSTELGQFISRDPLEYVDGMNMYSGYFAWGLLQDPSGLKKLDLTYDFDYETSWAETFFHLPNNTKTGTIGGVLGDIKVQVGKKFNKDGKCGNCVDKLSLTGHSGVPGLIDFESGGVQVTAQMIKKLNSELEKVRKRAEFGLKEANEFLSQVSEYLCEGATVDFVFCKSGRGPEGKILEQWLQQVLGPDVNIKLYANNVKWQYGTPVCEKISLSKK